MLTVPTKESIAKEDVCYNKWWKSLSHIDRYRIYNLVKDILDSKTIKKSTKECEKNLREGYVDIYTDEAKRR